MGLVGYWSFDYGKGGTRAYDMSGQGNHGTLTQMDAGTDWVDGKVGNALSFDGSDDYVNVGDIANYSFTDGAGTDSAFSLSAWVLLKDFSVAHTIVSKYNWNPTEWLVIYSGSAMYICTYNSTETASICRGAPFASGTYLDRWAHIVTTYSGSETVTGFKVYINGIQADNTDSSTGIYTGMSNTAAPVRIGARFTSGVVTLPFNGLIDDVRIYNRALSQAEITRLYKLTGPKVARDSLKDGLVGYWDFDYGKGGTRAYDMSGQGNHGTLTSMDVGTDWVDGKIGNALSFDGSDDYVYGGNAANLQLTTGTASAWIKTSGAGSSYRGIVVKQGAYGMFLKDNILTVYSWGVPTGDKSTSINLADGAWHYVVYSFQSGVTNGSQLYVDGVSRLTFTMLVSSQAVSATVGTGGWNGYPSETGGTLQHFLGLIDDVRVYSRALSADEIQRLYKLTGPKVQASQKNRLTNGLVGYWTFNGSDMSGNTANDVSGNGNNGTLTNGPARVAGKIGQGLSFDGVDDYVDVGGSSSLNFTSTSVFTISSWVYNSTAISGALDFRTILSKRKSATNQGYGWFYGVYSGQPFNNDNHVELVFYGGLELYTVYQVPANTWTHLAVSYNGNGTGTVYVNGEARTTTAYSSGSTADDTNLVIGRQGNYSTRYDYHKGPIDDVRIYNRALSAEEVRQLYNMGR